MFVTDPVLLRPDHAQEVVVDVSASGVCAVLSYDMGYWELLAVVLALQEWWHWLEGAAHPFIIWINHKNLSHCHTA